MSRIEDHFNKAFFSLISSGPAIDMLMDTPTELNLPNAFKAAVVAVVAVTGTTFAYAPHLLFKNDTPEGPQ